MRVVRTAKRREDIRTGWRRRWRTGIAYLVASSSVSTADMTETIAARDICAVRQKCAEFWERDCARGKYGHKGDAGQCGSDAHGWVLSAQKVGLISLFPLPARSLQRLALAFAQTHTKGRFRELFILRVTMYLQESTWVLSHLPCPGFGMQGNVCCILPTPAMISLSGDRGHAVAHR
jgi:hypothetical protein